MDYESWLLKEALEELSAFSGWCEVEADGFDWLVTFPYTAGDVPAPLDGSFFRIELPQRV